MATHTHKLIVNAFAANGDSVKRFKVVFPTQSPTGGADWTASLPTENGTISQEIASDKKFAAQVIPVINSPLEIRPATKLLTRY